MRLTELRTSVYRVPTDRPEGDGTIAWDSTTLVLVEAIAGSGERGLGFSYGAAAIAPLIHEALEPVILGGDVDEVGALHGAMVATVRNLGRQGMAAGAISAVDVALWDLKARLVGQPLFRLLGAYRESVPVYGSGGFTTYTDAELADQLGGWVAQGIPRVKMKIGVDWGTRPEEDVRRVRAARRAIGPAAELMVDANGAYSVHHAIGQAARFVDAGQISYFEEPVSSDHPDQLAQVRRRVPPGVAIAAGEYGYDPWSFARLLRAEAVDVLQADVTRCLGVTGWLEAAHLAHGFAVPLSAHTSPALHAQVGCAAPQISHVEYFHDHARIEQLLFDGAPRPVNGALRPDPAAPGLGLTLKRADAERWRIG
jgi:L-alanine-DL-glutamate epimerase-like enolase superfamily enzyme